MTDEIGLERWECVKSFPLLLLFLAVVHEITKKTFLYGTKINFRLFDF